MEDRVGKVEGDIRKMMKGVEKWGKKKTSIPGIFLVRMPSKEFRLKLLFMPVDEAGKPTKRKGFYFGDLESVKSARAAFLDDRLDVLVMAVEAISGEERKTGADDDEVLEI